MERHSELEVVPGEHHDVYGQSLPQVAPSLYDSPEVVPVEYKGHGKEALGGAERAGGYGAIPTPNYTTRRSRRICGLPARIFYAMLVGAILVVVGAAVGGVVGSSKAPQHKPDSFAPTPTFGNGTTANVNILAESRLSATNWTDVDGVTHHFVFFQDTHSAIIARIWDGENKTWATTNLTDILKSTRTPLNPLTPYTPLAAVAASYNNLSNEVHLYWIAPDNTIAAVASTDLLNNPDNWGFDDLGGASLVTTPGSQLAAAWNRCWFDCQGWWALAYQHEDGYGIRVANASDFAHAALAVEPREVAQNTSLAILPEILDGGLTRLTLVSESLGSGAAGTAQKSTYKTDWFDNGNLLHDVLPAPAPSVQFAVSQLDNFSSPVFLSLLPNGTVVGEYYDRPGQRGWVDLGLIDFSDGPPSGVNFSAIATTEEAMFYGVSGDQILQYSINAEDPSKFEFVGTVYP